MQDLDMSDNEGITNPPFELVEDLVVDFNTTDPVILDQLIVLGAVNNGDGTWLLQMKTALKFWRRTVWFYQILSDVLRLTVTFVARAYDRGDEDEGNGPRVIKETDVTIRFPETVDGNDSIAADIVIHTEPDDIILGVEDQGSIDLGQQILDKGILQATVFDDVIDELSIVFNSADLPAGFSIGGADFDYVTTSLFILHK